jgi:lyso-ornithine lipid O-acyltransferase
MRWCCAVRGSIRASLITLAYVTLTLPLMLLQWFLIHFKVRGLPHFYHRLVCRLLGMTVVVEGALPQQPYLLVSNHSSWLDVSVLSSVLPVSFIAKSEVGAWPLFGTLAKLQRTVFVEREKRQTTGTKRAEIAARLQSGDCLVLFPEGTSSDGTGVLPFKSSYFGAAENLDVAVVPATLSYSGPIYAWYGDMDLLPHIWAVLKSGPLIARVTFHPPLEKADRKTMAREAEATVRASLHVAPEIR